MPRLTIAGLIAAMTGLPVGATGQPAVTPSSPPSAAAPAEPGLTTQGPGFNAPAGLKCAPEQLFRAVVRNVSPGLAAADRRAQPRTIYRKGAAYFRTDELPDPVRGDQVSVIVAEPDIWNVDFATRQAQHQTDPGPSFDVHAPIVPPGPDTPPAFMALEFGCEAAFVAAYAPRPQRTVAWGPTVASLHVATLGDRSLAILMDDRRQQPLMISYLKGAAPVFVVRYDDYRQGLADRQGLFEPPKWTGDGKAGGDDAVVALPDTPPGEAVIPLPREPGQHRGRGGGGRRRQQQQQPF